jgi:hypothetical protein
MELFKTLLYIRQTRIYGTVQDTFVRHTQPTVHGTSAGSMLTSENLLARQPPTSRGSAAKKLTPSWPHADQYISVVRIA